MSAQRVELLSNKSLFMKTKSVAVCSLSCEEKRLYTLNIAHFWRATIVRWSHSLCRGTSPLLDARIEHAALNDRKLKLLEGRLPSGIHHLTHEIEVGATVDNNRDEVLSAAFFES